MNTIAQNIASAIISDLKAKHSHVDDAHYNGDISFRVYAEKSCELVLRACQKLSDGLRGLAVDNDMTDVVTIFNKALACLGWDASMSIDYIKTDDEDGDILTHLPILCSDCDTIFLNLSGAAYSEPGHATYESMHSAIASAFFDIFDITRGLQQYCDLDGKAAFYNVEIPADRRSKTIYIAPGADVPDSVISGVLATAHAATDEPAADVDTIFTISCTGYDQEDEYDYFWAEWNGRDGMYSKHVDDNDYDFDRGECSISAFFRHYNPRGYYSDALGDHLCKALANTGSELDALPYAFFAALDGKDLKETQQKASAVTGISRSYFFELLGGLKPEDRARRIMLAYLRTPLADREKIFKF